MAQEVKTAKGQNLDYISVEDPVATMYSAYLLASSIKKESDG